MKKSLLFLIFMAAFSQTLFGQAFLDVNLPSTAPATTQVRAPNGLSSHTVLRAHFIISSSEASAALVSGTLLKKIGFVLTGGTNVAAGGQIKIYLQNTSDASNLKSTTWATAITGMSEVYNGAYILPTGTTTPSNIIMNLTTPFTYTGGGLYVAYDYSGTSFATSSATYASNNSIAASLRNGSSTTTTPPSTLNESSAFRPQMIFSYDNPYDNDIEVTSVGRAYGNLNRLWLGENAYTVIVRNRSSINKSNISVQLDITGVNPQTENKTISSLAAGESTSVSFTPNLPNSGDQTITASVPGDQNNSNNSKSVGQNISCDFISYAGNVTPYDGIGFNTGEGLLAVKYKAPADVKVSSVKVRLSNNVNNVGRLVRGVIVNSSNAVIATSADFIITALNNNTEVTLALNSPVTFNNGEEFYACLAQTAGTPGYFPVGTAEPINTPANLYFSFPLNGGQAPTNYTNLGNLMIGAVVEANPVVSSSVTGVSCGGATVTYTATAGFNNYNFKVNGTSQQNTASNTFAYVPLDNDVITVDVDKNGCLSTTNSLTASVGPTTPVPSGAAIQSFEAGNDLSVLVVTGQNIKWYANASDAANHTNVLPITTVIVNDTTYYATQTVNGCESLISLAVKAYNETLSVDSINKGKGTFIYPNPVKDILHLQSESKIQKVIITETSGRKISEKLMSGNPKETLDVHSLPKGMYLIQIITETGSRMIKFVKD